MTSSGFTWADFYLICFAVGFCFSFISFVFGSPRLGHLHLPHYHGHGVPHVPAAHGPVVTGSAATAGHAAGGQGAASSGGSGRFARAGAVSPLNPPTIAAFLAWFGGTGYLLTRFSAFRVGMELLLSVLVGLAGGAIVFLFLSRVLMSDQEYMNFSDYDMVGVLGRLSVPIRPGGTGELIYSQAGTRRVCGARSEDGSPMPKGAEVVVTRYDKGIAYVSLWSEMSGEEDDLSAERSKRG